MMVPQDSHGPRDSRPRKPAREGIKNGRIAREKRCAQVLLLHQRAPYINAYALQASDPYAFVYKRQALPPADPLPMKIAWCLILIIVVLIQSLNICTVRE